MPQPGLFTPQNAAMLLIDHQVGTMKLIQNLPLERVMRNTLALAKTAQVFGLPTVITTSQESMFQGPIFPELAALLPDAHEARVKRAGIVNAWDDSNFLTAVRNTGRTHLIMAGVTTDVCLVYPAISAVREGYHVQAVMDASGSPWDLSEDLARRRMERAGVVLTATVTLMAELAQDWSTPHGEKLKDTLFTEVFAGVL